MSYRRQKRQFRIASFDIVSQTTGNTIGHADDADEVMIRAEDYKQNPEILFIGIDQDGYQVNTWSLGEVLNGTFEAELAS
jgi:hypothetical protein